MTKKEKAGFEMSTKTQELDWTFSLGQIQDHCEKIDNLCLNVHPDGELMFQSSQIIKELLEKLDCLIVERCF